MQLDPQPDMVLPGADGARCGLWWRSTPPYPEHRTGLIGHYKANGFGAALKLLSEACEILADRGCTLAIGPMDGSVWDSYRFVTNRGPEPVSSLEPDNPDSWPRHFISAGFRPLARYYSALSSSLGAVDPEVEETAARLVREGYVFRNPVMQCFEDELRRIHRIASAAFEGGFLFTPITEARFLLKYRALQSRIHPELVQLVEFRGEPCAFLLAMPDPAREDTIILKTLAVRPEHRRRGLGKLLVCRAHHIAHEYGFRRAIHVLMHERNASVRLSGRTALRVRSFTLFGRPLANAGSEH
jgi:GNAT superfamily N-acetyltransferase